MSENEEFEDAIVARDEEVQELLGNILKKEGWTTWIPEIDEGDPIAIEIHGKYVDTKIASIPVNLNKHVRKKDLKDFMKWYKEYTKKKEALIPRKKEIDERLKPILEKEGWTTSIPNVIDVDNENYKIEIRDNDENLIARIPVSLDEPVSDEDLKDFMKWYEEYAKRKEVIMSRKKEIDELLKDILEKEGWTTYVPHDLIHYSRNYKIEIRDNLQNLIAYIPVHLERHLWGEDLQEFLKWYDEYIMEKQIMTLRKKEIDERLKPILEKEGWTTYVPDLIYSIEIEIHGKNGYLTSIPVSLYRPFSDEDYEEFMEWYKKYKKDQNFMKLYEKWRGDEDENEGQ
ncbi:MAG: hypothetical protein C0179_04265 [Fervidicoccus sp.]|nr:MAG: hypothetical protein C0179_04265 [Fervidicoccus sp.]